jgi:integrase
MEEIDSLLARFQRYRPGALPEGDPTIKNGPQWSAIRAQLELEGQPVKRHSKKYMLQRLARYDDWRISLFDAMPTKYKAASAVMHLTGCRPSELKNVVELKIVGDRLALSIIGTKVTKSSGQPKRVLVVDPNDSVAAYLRDQVKAGLQYVHIISPKALTEAVAAAGHKAFPKLKARASPYLWRHALSSDMKSAGLSSDQIAMVLSHRVTRTQTYYGRHAHGSGSVSIVAVHATLGVRDTQHDPCSLSPTPSRAGPALGM